MLPHLIGCKIFAILGLGFSKFGSISCFTASQTVGRLAALQQNILNRKGNMNLPSTILLHPSRPE
jgi:hypothetical protein